MFHPSIEALRLLVVEASATEDALWESHGISKEHTEAANRRAYADMDYCHALVRTGVFQKAAEYLSERIGEPVEVDWYDTGDPDVEYWCAPVQASVLDEDGLVAEFAICDAAGEDWVEHLLRSLSDGLLRSVHP
jgi:hypothetical protein